jgi:hypothetical protein
MLLSTQRRFRLGDISLEPLGLLLHTFYQSSPVVKL